MTVPGLNEYKERERQSWNSVAPAWLKWWKTIEKGTEKVSIRLVELAEIKRGSRVVDIATGIGEPAITAAKKIDSGLNGHILATDISSQMLSIARQRASFLGLQDVIEFREGDAETIDLPPSAFDAALCRFGLMFLPNLKVGLINIYQSLLEGGHFATAVWASPEKVPFIFVPMNTVLKETNNRRHDVKKCGDFTFKHQVYSI